MMVAESWKLIGLATQNEIYSVLSEIAVREIISNSDRQLPESCRKFHYWQDSIVLFQVDFKTLQSCF